jgi:organic hydroperoxide reductase OsmC/OhrA
MPKRHEYALRVVWTGNLGAGTTEYKGYARDHRIEASGKSVIEGSSDPAFRGDPSRWSPEELFVASISACHMLWYLHLCSSAGVIVHSYRDEAIAEMLEENDGSGRFVEVVLRPCVEIASGSDAERARALHAHAHAKCFIANSVSCPVEVRLEVKVIA